MTGFADTESIASWAYDSLAMMINNGLLSGKLGSTISPGVSLSIQ